MTIFTFLVVFSWRNRNFDFFFLYNLKQAARAQILAMAAAEEESSGDEEEELKKILIQICKNIILQRLQTA